MPPPPPAPARVLHAALLCTCTQVVAAAAEAGGVVPESARSDVLLEVANLVEAPTVIRGGFDPAFLDLPKWVKGSSGGRGVGVGWGAKGGERSVAICGLRFSPIEPYRAL